MFKRRRTFDDKAKENGEAGTSAKRDDPHPPPAPKRAKQPPHGQLRLTSNALKVKVSTGVPRIQEAAGTDSSTPSSVPSKPAPAALSPAAIPKTSATSPPVGEPAACDEPTRAEEHLQDALDWVTTQFGLLGAEHLRECSELLPYLVEAYANAPRATGCHFVRDGHGFLKAGVIQCNRDRLLSRLLENMPSANDGETGLNSYLFATLAILCQEDRVKNAFRMAQLSGTPLDVIGIARADASQIVPMASTASPGLYVLIDPGTGKYYVGYSSSLHMRWTHYNLQGSGSQLLTDAFAVKKFKDWSALALAEVESEPTDTVLHIMELMLIASSHALEPHGYNSNIFDPTFVKVPRVYGIHLTNREVALVLTAVHDLQTATGLFIPKCAPQDPREWPCFLDALQQHSAHKADWLEKLEITQLLELTYGKRRKNLTVPILRRLHLKYAGAGPVGLGQQLGTTVRLPRLRKNAAPAPEWITVEHLLKHGRR